MIRNCDMRESTKEPFSEETCLNQMMWRSSVKTKKESEFVFQNMVQKGLRFQFINHTLIKDENWTWIDIDGRPLQVGLDVELINSLNVSSTGKERMNINIIFIK